jgi:hypothetical protein
MHMQAIPTTGPTQTDRFVPAGYTLDEVEREGRFYESMVDHARREHEREPITNPDALARFERIVASFEAAASAC